VSDLHGIVSGVTGHETKAAALRAAMADQVERDFPHLSAPTLAIFRQVPRHAFIPEVDLETAYINDAVITHRDPEGRTLSSISQPSMVAQMLDLLDLRSGQRVLEIGAGTFTGLWRTGTILIRSLLAFSIRTHLRVASEVAVRTRIISLREINY